MVNITINGQDFSVGKNLTILQACRENGIYIPTLCYDDRLSGFGGCRLCIVDVEGYNNYVASCVVQVHEGMVIETDTAGIREARKTLLELLVSNHPMECLTCEKVGKCDLQDYAYEYDALPVFEGERAVYPIEAQNPVMLRDQSKCIKCGKCVRVCDEVQNTYAIDFVSRGFDSKIAAGFDLPLDDKNCRLCGQCIDVCPTGAILNKQFFGHRMDEMEKVRTTCPFCGTGCSFDLNVLDGKVIGVTAAEDAVVNGMSLCVKGRYHTDMIYSENRITTPMKKVDGQWQETTWDDALNIVATKFQQIKDDHGSDALAGLSSARTTNEDNFAFQKFMRVVLGTNNVDHCART